MGFQVFFRLDLERNKKIYTSLTVLYTGRPKVGCLPALPGETPPTTLVPYPIESFAFNDALC